MAEDLALKEILTASSPLIKAVVDTFVTPKLERIKSRITTGLKKNIVPTDTNFKEYFCRSYKKYSFVNTLVFNNSRQLLKDIYIPLTLSAYPENTLFCVLTNSFSGVQSGFPDSL